MIRVFYPESKLLSPSQRRIRSGLLKYCIIPISIVDDSKKADIHIYDYFGYDFLNPPKCDIPLKPLTRNYVVLYHCPPPPNVSPIVIEKLDKILRGAKLVITFTKFFTFYSGYHPFKLNYKDINFYITPWGFDPQIFYPEQTSKEYDLGFMGLVDESERIRDIYLAVKKLRVNAIHLCGQSLRDVEQVVKDVDSPYVKRVGYLSDDELRLTYAKCKYFASFRMHVGFELPVIESAACGSQPLTLDFPCYREHFNDIAIFINPRDVVNSLINVISSGKTRNIDFNYVRLKFSWEFIAPKIWNRILEVIKA